MPAEPANEVLDRLTAVGLIDDRAFAELWVRSRHRERGLARAALRQELTRKGVEPQVADEALSQLDADDEHATARRLVERKLATTRGLPTETRIRRMVSLLARKGYSSSAAYAVVRAALRDHEALELTEESR